MSIVYADRFDNGTWLPVPIVDVNGTKLVVTGSWLKRAAVDAEECAESELSEPRVYVDALTRHRAQGLTVDLFTFVQRIPSTDRKYDYTSEPESIAAIRLTSFDGWWNALPQESRKNVRRAGKRGVTIVPRSVDDELVKRIVEINNETPIRQGRRFTHYGESYEHVRRDFLAFADRSDLLCAYVGEELIGLIKIVYCGDIATIVKLQTKISHADKRPANALMASAIERCCDKGASHVAYGLFRYGNQTWTTLMEFKARHGFQEIIVPRYFVPLSAMGAVSSKLRLHRGAVGILPASLVQKGRALRSYWTSGRIAGVAQR